MNNLLFKGINKVIQNKSLPKNYKKSRISLGI